MVTMIAIVSGSVIALILLGTLLVKLYRHAKTLPIMDFLKEVLITVLIISVITLIISLWILFPEVVIPIVGVLAMFAFVGLIIYASFYK